MPTPLQVLILEDRDSDARLIVHELGQAGFAPDWIQIQTEPHFLGHLKRSLDLILADYRMPQFSALRALELMRNRGLDIPFIIVSGSIGEEQAVQAMQLGATDYLLKDRLGRLGQAVTQALGQRQLRQANRHAEQSLRESEERFRSAFEDTNVAMVLTDLDNRFLRVNAAFARLFGYAETEMLGMAMADITHPDDLAESYERRRTLLADDTHFFQMEKRYLHKDGRVLWGLTNVSLVRDARGRPQFYVGQIQDITERKRAEQEIANYNERLRILRQIDKALIAGEGPAAIAAAALVPLRELLEVPRAVVNLFDLAKGEVEGLAAAGRRRVHVGPRVRYSLRLMGDVEALQRGELQLIDVHALPPSPEVDALLASGVHVYVVVPMIAEGELIGALSFGGASAPLSPEQVSIAQEAATQFAIALAQARLHEQVKRQAQELEARVAERKFAETERDALLARLRMQIDRMPLAYFLLDAAGRIVDWNSSAERTFGYTKEEALGIARPHETLVPQAVWPETAAIIARLQAGDMAAHSINENLTKDGRIITCEWFNTPLMDAEGKFAGVISLAQDITERKRLETQVRDAQKHLEHVLSASPAVLYALRLDGDSVRPTWVSDNMTRLTGFSPSEATHDGWWETQLHPDDRQRTVAGLAVMATEDFCTQEYRIRRKDGTYCWILDNRRVFRDAQGRPAEAVGSWTDISDRKSLEEQFRQAQKLEAVGRLAGGVAHDFNNLLTIITGYSELIVSSLRAGDPLREMVEQISKAGAQAAGLTRQLLAFSRKQVLQPVVLDLNARIVEIEKMLRRLIGEDIDLEFHPASALWPVKVDPGQIEQVLMNLVVNARDAMPRGGKLTIETANVELDDSYIHVHAQVKTGRHVLVAVTDTGCGMDAATQARIFEPFFTTKSPDKGTGLGLATVFGIVQQSGGHIEVYSEPGMGSTFKVYLPSNREGMGVRPSQTDFQALPQGTETVLLVEDAEGIRTLARLVLQKNGYKVLEAQNGGEALLTCEQYQDKIHLLITDVVMPNMSGRQLAERLQPLRPEMKVLYMSGYTDDSIVRHGVLAAGTSFLQKPFTPNALSRKVREVLNAKTA